MQKVERELELENVTLQGLWFRFSQKPVYQLVLAKRERQTDR